MKFIAYNVRDDEIPFIEQWGREQKVEVTYNTTTLNNTTLIDAQGFDGISALQTIPYSAELFASMKKMGIHYLALRNVGIDNVDLKAARDNGIQITNVPAYSPASIAEFAVMMALYLSRKVGYMDQQLRDEREFHFSPKFMGRLISDQTVGIIGTGRIGQFAIKYFKGLGARVIAYDKFPVANPDGFTYTKTIADLVQESDIISLHMPATTDNYHLFDESMFKAMKPEAILINTARGSIVDTQAMINALEAGRIGGAGVDTIEHESADLQDSRSTKRVTDPEVTTLMRMPNAIITPHSAFHTSESVKNMVDISLNNLKLMAEGQTPADLIK